MAAAERVDCIVIGAGAIGLACARELSFAGREVLVLETAGMIGSETSSRNSEVIHAGIYYPQNSLKARLCKTGRDALYHFSREFSVPHRKVGKLIVGNGPHQHASLHKIEAAAKANGVQDLRWLLPAEIAAMEPAVRADHALFSPSTGIIDSHAYMATLEAHLVSHGGSVILNAPVLGGTVRAEGIEVVVGGQHGISLLAQTVVNSAGLCAPAVSRRITGLNPATIPQEFYAIGHYYRLSGRSPCSHLVYPVPEEGGLGIHLTLDLGGQAKFGPDVRWIDKIDYAFDDSRRAEFISGIQAYLPGIEPDRLQPDYTGIRPKLSGPASAPADFRIDGPSHHDTPGYVALYGIESPGLTSSLAIANEVAALVSAGGPAR